MPIGAYGFGSSSNSTPAWKIDEAWRENRRAAAQEFLDSNVSVASALQGAFLFQSEGLATLAAKASISRLRSSVASRKSLVNILA
ncbi:MAG: hypothetical protein HY056_07760 [Proteobacteria bacterium]|nr:hypothetical protein [Pseudomonadota bacterium]